MIPDLDIYRCVNLLVKRHGQDAPIEAAMRADAMLDKGDLDGYATWRLETLPGQKKSRSIAAPGPAAVGARSCFGFLLLTV